VIFAREDVIFLQVYLQHIAFVYTLRLENLNIMLNIQDEDGSYFNLRISAKHTC